MNRREFVVSIGSTSLVLSRTAGSNLPSASAKQEPLLDPNAPLRIGMIGRTGHLGYVLDEFEKVKGARLSAYSFEDDDWKFNSDGSQRKTGYDLSRQQEWIDHQPWAASSRPTIYATYQEMLEKEKLDVVAVYLPYARNAFAIKAAADAGIHVISEKPVAINFHDLEMVEKAVNQSGIRLSAMFALRYSPPIFTIKRNIQRGIIGNPHLAKAQKSYKWGEDRPWFYKHPEIFGSTILWVGIHAVDFLRWCSGLEVLRVSGFHSNLSHSDYPGVQDNAVINLELEGGATASVTMDYLRPGTAPTHGDDRLRIAGSKGIIETQAWNGKVELINETTGPHPVELERPSLSLFADFISELRGQGVHLIGKNDAVQVSRICIAATHAANTKSVIQI